MALQILPATPILSMPPMVPYASSSSTTLNAAGHSTSFIGHLVLEAGSGSKTLDNTSAIRTRFGSVTFANAGTTLRIGLQDVASSGIEDGTFDVYADLVGGTDTITSNSFRLTNMTTGSKVLTHGDLIAVSIEMISRGGVDSVIVNSSSITAGSFTTAYFPYRTTDTGSGVTKTTAGQIGFTIEFADGTLGWLFPSPMLPAAYVSTGTNVTSNMTPDEYAAVFSLPYKATIDQVMQMVSITGATSTGEIILYSDPEGTPIAERTVVFNPEVIGSTSPTVGVFWTPLGSPITLDANTLYALAVRPTSVNSVGIGHYALGTGNSKYKKALPFGANVKRSGRTNQTGAFVEIDDTHLPLFGLSITHLDDGIGGGSSASSYGFA